MGIITIIYGVILAYFLLGAIGFYMINRKREKAVARKSWIKYIVYFFIINLLFFSIVVQPLVFRLLAAIIITMGVAEMIVLYRKNHFTQSGFFVLSILLYLILAAGFWNFSGARMELILFTFIILSIFDAFSQISGQLWGKTKIVPQISPNKTIGGTVGGVVIALASAFLLRGLNTGSTGETLVMAAGIIFFAFIGDISASYYKRRFNVKDYSNMIPGHGGFLDRFDSLIAGGAWVALFLYI